MSGVRCLKCERPVSSTTIIMAHPGFAMSSRPTFRNEPCGHHAGLLFDFTDPPEHVEQMTQGPGELR